MAILKDLIVHGSSRFLNKIYASEIQTPLIEAEAGIFKKLKADDATVVGLLDVKGQLHTNSWSNSNIATIDGSFYITPTIGSDSGTVTITATSLNFSGTNYAVTSLYLGDNSSITWPQYSKVLVTGQILSNGEWIPLGTLLGQLSAQAAAASIKINNIKDNKNQTSNVLATLVNNGTTSSDYRNLKVSLYQRASSSTAFYPLGIYITATGDNGRTFLDIYGGVESLENNANHGGFAEPNVRIGNLQGLPNVGGQSPNGWGIYTDNGYFKGIIAADRGYIGTGSKYWVIGNYEDGSNSDNDRSYIYNGTNSTTSTIEGVYLGTDGIRNYKDSTHYVTIKNGVISAIGANLSGKIIASSGSIGGWNIGTDTNKSLYHGNQTPGATTTNLVLSPTSATNSNAIGGSSTGLTWFISAGKVFGVTTAGTLYCNDAHISGEITATSGTIGGASITDGTLIVGNTNINDINASKINAGDIAAARIQTNLISAINAKVSDLSALTATIGGFQINSSSIHTKNVAITSNADNSIALSSADFTRTINSTSRTGLRFAIGDKLGVTGDGKIYASSVDLTGKITATSGSIGGIEIENGALKVSSINIGNLGGASNYAKKTDVTQAIDNIEIGGRNLVWNSNFHLPINGTWNNWGSPTTREIVTINGENWMHIVTTANSYQGYSQNQANRNGFGEIQAGEQIIFSFDAYSKVDGQKGCIGIHWRNSNDTNLYQDWTSFDLTTTKKRYVTKVFTVPNNVVGFNIMIGQSVATAQELWITNIKGEKGNKATAWTPAPEDINAEISTKADSTDAVFEEQLIYISKASGTLSVDGTTTWITGNGDVQNTWSTKRPTYNTDYPVLFIAKQRKTVSGTVTCTTPTKDDTTTVIDGGHIATGTIDASRVNVTNINGNSIITGTISIGTVNGLQSSLNDKASNSALANATGWSVIISVTTINYSTNSATLEATVYKDGTKQTTGFTLEWYQTKTTNGTTSTSKLTTTTSTLSVNNLDASYTCVVN